MSKKGAAMVDCEIGVFIEVPPTFQPEILIYACIVSLRLEENLTLEV